MNQPRDPTTGQFGAKVDSEGYSQFLGQLLMDPEAALDKLADKTIQKHLTAMLPGLMPILKGITGSDPHGKAERGYTQVSGADIGVE